MIFQKKLGLDAKVKIKPDGGGQIILSFKNLDELSSKDNAFFSVNVVARKSEKNTPETNPYMKKFIKLSPWRPKDLAVFAGKIDYQNYKFIDRHMIRLIMWIGKGPTNLNGSYEFTNWDEVKKFGKVIKEM